MKLLEFVVAKCSILIFHAFLTIHACILHETRYLSQHACYMHGCMHVRDEYNIYIYMHEWYIAIAIQYTYNIISSCSDSLVELISVGFTPIIQLTHCDIIIMHMNTVSSFNEKIIHGDLNSSILVASMHIITVCQLMYTATVYIL